MGRHSAPDDDDDVAPADVPAGAPADVPADVPADPDRPRPTPDGGGEDAPAPEGLALIEDALDDSDRGSAPVGPMVAPPPGPAVVVDAQTAETAVLPVIDAPLARDVPPPGPSTAPAPGPLPGPPADAPSEPRPRPPSGVHATRHDIGLVTRHGDVRARVVAAVLVPFVVFVAVLAVIGELTVHHLIWVWAPAVTAGVLVGLVLDAGHRRYPAPAPTEPVTERAGPA